LKAPEVQVNGRTKRLGGSAHKQDAQEVMAQVKSVVADALRRLDADFSENALYLCLEAFDLHLWEEVARNRRILDQCAEVLAKASALRQSSKTLFEAVGVDLQWAMFVRAANFALTTRAALSAEVPKRLRNRVAWVEALCDSAGQ